MQSASDRNTNNSLMKDVVYNALFIAKIDKSMRRVP